jgi:O-antigen/teichoic acid export membrane protein
MASEIPQDSAQPPPATAHGQAPQESELDDAPRRPLPAPPALEFAALVPWLRSQLTQLQRSLRNLRSVIRLRPFDTSTPEGRSNERYRRAALTTVVSTTSRVLGIFTGLAWLRISFSYLGRERYGLWMAVGSLITWANLADLGLARGMQNHLSHASGKDDPELAARYVSTGLFTLGSIALALAVACSPAVLLVPWTRVLSVENPALAGETRAVVAAVLACFLLEFPLSVVPTIFAAYQRGYVSAAFNVLGSLLSLATLIAVTRLGLQLPWLIVATSGSGIVMTMLSFAYALKSMPWIRPRFRFATVGTLRALAATSGALFVFQIGALLINQTQNLIIARRLGLAEVADWTILMRVYVLPAAVIQVIDLPLIPAFRDAYVRGEQHWLRTAFWRVTKLKLVIAVVAAGLFPLLGDWVASLLAGQGMHFSWQLWVASAFLLLVAVWNSSFNDLLISVDRLRLLVITVLINGLVTPVLSYFLAPSLGLLGVMLATPLFSFAVSGWLLPLACRDLLEPRAEQRAS